MTTLLSILCLAAATTWQLLPYLVVGVLASEALRYTSVAPLLERGCRSHPAVALCLVLGLFGLSACSAGGTRSVAPDAAADAATGMDMRWDTRLNEDRSIDANPDAAKPGDFDSSVVHDAGIGSAVDVPASPDVGTDRIDAYPSVATDAPDAAQEAAPSVDAQTEASPGLDPFFEMDKEGDGMHPFVIPLGDRAPGPTDLSALSAANETSRITVGPDGRLQRNGVRYRLFGTNLIFDACVPPQEEADVMAARLAKVGYNAVRLHHCDSFFGWPLLLDYTNNRGDLVEKNLDRLHYLVSALKKHGIYVDINLLVSRRFLPGDSDDPNAPLPVAPITAGETWSDDAMQESKALGFFYDPVLKAQQGFAERLLARINPYTNLSLAKDPVVAVVEIANETGLVNYWLWSRLDKMSPLFLAELQRKWNAWLKAKYASDGALNTAWGGTASARELLSNTALVSPPDPWRLSLQGTAAATLSVEANADGTKPAMRIDVTTASSEAWHLTLAQAGLHLTPGVAYRISMRVKASSDRTFQIDLRNNKDPWNSFTPGVLRNLTTTWQDFVITYRATSDVSATDDIRLEVSGLGHDLGKVWVSSPSLLEGGPVLAAGESVATGTVPRVERQSQQPWAPAALPDWVAFLRDTEAAYYSNMSTFLKQTLGVQALLLGSQITTSPPTVQAALDIVDTHAYWDPPQYSGEPYDPVNWKVLNQSSLFSPPGVVGGARGLGGGLSGTCVKGKPHFATETNHLPPNEYSAEGPLLTAAYAALADMDGIFFFEWDMGEFAPSAAIGTYEGDASQSVKVVNMPAAARMFREFDVSRANTVWTVAMDPQTELTTILKRGYAWTPADASLRDFPMEATTIGRVEMDLSQGAVDSTFPSVSGMTTFASDTNELTWDKQKGIVTINTKKTRALIGFTDSGSFALGGPGVDCAASPTTCVVFKPGVTLLGFSTLALSLVEGESFTTGSGRALLAATGNARNTGMTWTDKTKTSVADQWGTAPVRVEVIPATIILPRPASGIHVYALDGRGQRIAEIAVTGDTTASFKIGDTYSTLWYEIVLGDSKAIGDGDTILNACAGYCGRVSGALPSCYASRRDCLEDCDWWTATTLGSACTCATVLDAFWACDQKSAPDSRVCGRLSQGVPPSTNCIESFMQAFNCAGNSAVCSQYEERLLDDFEDGNATSGQQGFSGWRADSDAASSIAPRPFAPEAHGANGSHFAAHVTGRCSSWAELRLNATNSAGLDLSTIQGVAFTAKGEGTIRFSVSTTDMSAAGNFDPYGLAIDLSSTWRRYTVRFDDPRFKQRVSGAKTVFNPSRTESLTFAAGGPGAFDFHIDDVVLLVSK